MLLMLRTPAAVRRSTIHAGEGPTFTPFTTATCSRGQPSRSSTAMRTPSSIGGPERHGVARRQLARHTLVAEEVGAVRGDVDDDAVVADRDRLRQRGAGGRVDVELEESVGVLAEPELLGGAEHPLRELTADLPLLEEEAAGEGRPHPREGILLPRRHVGGAADHLLPGLGPVVDRGDAEPVG